MASIRDKKILAIAPHIDDVELGAGGTVYHLGKNNQLWYVGLSLPPLVEPAVFSAEFERSSAVLGLIPDRVILKDFDPRDLFASRGEILQLLYDLGKDIKPDIALIPSSSDIHQSHEVVHAEARRALKYSSILGYELPWNNFNFKMDAFISLDHTSVMKKVEAIDCFTTQRDRMFFANRIVEDLARVRGKQIGVDYAECFEVIRVLL